MAPGPIMPGIPGIEPGTPPGIPGMGDGPGRDGLKPGIAGFGMTGPDIGGFPMPGMAPGIPGCGPAPGPPAFGAAAFAACSARLAICFSVGRLAARPFAFTCSRTYSRSSSLSFTNGTMTGLRPCCKTTLSPATRTKVAWIVRPWSSVQVRARATGAAPSTTAVAKVATSLPIGSSFR
jgi:hypothetical protein